MSKETNTVKKMQLSIESNISLDNSYSILDYIEIANKLNIPIIVANSINIDERNKLITETSKSKFELISLTQIYESMLNKNYSLEQTIDAIKKYIIDMDSNQHVVLTRRNISSTSIEEIKRSLAKVRFQYELVCIHSDSKNILKWAVTDRRTDVISVDFGEDVTSIDSALCSLIKQNEKLLEISLSSLLTLKDAKGFSQALRNGKKLIKLLKQNQVSFIFSMSPVSPLHLRNGSQMRYLGELLGISYNKSKNSVFENLFSKLVSNTMKIHDSSILEGVKEVR
jgi:RNase P/RNase MRP subunit p30